MRPIVCWISTWFVLSFLGLSQAMADEMRLAVTTSFHNSGLAEKLLPIIKKDTELDVRLIVVGTGQALRLGKAGDVDAILVHSKSAEEAFVAEGYGVQRTEIMYNDFIIVGPTEDPARIGNSPSARQALAAIEQSRELFVSRGDESGTHKKEIGLWRSANLEVEHFDVSWYRASGSGMGATLNVAIGSNGYVLTDRATWLNFGNKGGHKILYEGDPDLFNQYAFLRVNPKRHPHVKDKSAAALEQWLISEEGQALIGSYTIAGERLFVPNANRSK